LIFGEDNLPLRIEIYREDGGFFAERHLVVVAEKGNPPLAFFILETLPPPAQATSWR